MSIMNKTENNKKKNKTVLLEQSEIKKETNKEDTNENKKEKVINKVKEENDDDKKVKEESLNKIKCEKSISSIIKKIVMVWVIIGIIVLLLYYSNNKIDITEYNYISNKVSKDIDGYTIVQISDLHNKLFGSNNSKLIKKVKEVKPNMIVITGDIVDYNKTDVKIAIDTAKKLREVAVTYYVTGNHEYGISEQKRNELIDGLESVGIIIMQNRLEIINEDLCVIGIDEREIIGYGAGVYASGNPKEIINTLIKSAEIEEDTLKILLAHEPQEYKKYIAADIVFTGHAHGGQFRIPFINKGIVAPDQGFLPKYTEGRYNYKNTSMYISRGLGNSIIPQRIFNNPEIVKVTLKRKVSKNNKDV